MTGQDRHLQSPAEWLVNWLHGAGGHSQSHSLVLRSCTGASLEEFSHSLANYLNEFDGHAGSHWRTFDPELLELLSNDHMLRDLILGEQDHSSADHRSTSSDGTLHRVARRLASLGGVILLGPGGAEAAHDLETTFHVCLCADKPPSHCRYHMLVNPTRFSDESLVCVVADSFLDWSCQAHHLSPTTRRMERDPSQ